MSPRTPYPPRSHPATIAATWCATARNGGFSATSSSRMPCTVVASSLIGTSGSTSQ